MKITIEIQGQRTLVEIHNDGESVDFSLSPPAPKEVSFIEPEDPPASLPKSPLFTDYSVVSEQTKICENCTKEYQPLKKVAKRARFCSKECRQAFLRHGEPSPIAGRDTAESDEAYQATKIPKYWHNDN